MSNCLRSPWVLAEVRLELARAVEKRDQRTFQADEVLSTIGPLGELQFPGGKTKPLQVLQFLSFEDPYTAILSDKGVFISCKFSSEARLKYEASKKRLSELKGGLIKINSYRICLFGVDGISFWKGDTYQAQVADEPISRKTGKGAKNGIRSNNAGGSKPTEKTFKAGNIGVNPKALPMPEPVLFIIDFTPIGSEGSARFGNPVSISSRADIRVLLSDLPRKECSEEEVLMSLKEIGVPSVATKAAPHQGSKGRVDKYQKGNSSTQGGSSRKNVPSKSPRSLKNMNDSDDEIRSQPDVGDDDTSSQEDLQLPFATQAPPRFSESFATQAPPRFLATFDDLDFSTQASQGNKAHAKSPLLSPHKSPPGLVGRPSQAAITKTQEKNKDPRPHQARKNAGQSKGLVAKQRLINYADGSDSEETATGSAAKGVVPNDISEGAGNQNKRKRDRLDNPSASDSSSASVKNSKRLPAHQGWQGMRRVTKEEVLIPKDQQEILDRPESWYPYKDTRHISGYDAVSKVQLVPKSHPPRDHPTLPHAQIVVPTITIPNSPPPPSSSELSWSSSPDRSPVRDVNAMPPDSSIPTGSQQRAGRWSVQVNDIGNPGSSTEGSIYQPDQVSTQQEAEERGGKDSRIQSPSSDSDEGDGLNDISKRVTRAANGISKKAPVDPNNVELSRMSRTNQKPKLPVARKRRRSVSEPEEPSENDETSEDENIQELIKDPGLPVEVINPNGRTRVAMFGGILKAQQVTLWERQRKRAQEPGGGTKSVVDDDGSGTQSGDDASDKQLGPDNNGIGSDAFRVPVLDVAEYATLGSPSANKGKRAQESLLEAKDTVNQSHSERLLGLGNGLMDIVEGDPPPNAIKPARHSVIAECLSSEPNQTVSSELEKDTISELIPESSLELPMAEEMDIDGPQTAINNGTEEVSKDLQAKAPGDSLSTAILLQTSSALEVPNTSGSQKSTKNITSPSLPSSTNTAPTVQVEETPYRKGLKVMREGNLSPTVSRLRISPGYLEDGFDDITRIPGTNTEELHNSSAPTLHRIAQSSPLRREGSPESQVVSLSRESSSIESENPRVNPPDDFAMSQQQLRRELLEHQEVEVPATSEVEETRIEDDIRSKPPPIFKLKPMPGKARKVFKAVDFETQEISAATNSNHVSSMLEEQKRQFMGSEGAYEIEDMFQGNISSLASERLSQEPEAGVSKSHTPSEDINTQGSPVPSVTSHLSFRSNEDMASDFSRSNIRKRPQSPPSKISIPTKKPRANSESPYKTEHFPASVPPPFIAMHEGAGTLTKPQNKSSAKPASKGSPEGEDLELSDDDPMTGFVSIGSPNDDFEPSWPPQTSSEPEMYAGIRKRNICVPGYGKLTDDQKKELDIRRQEYFGVKTSSKRLFSIELQRTMQKVSSSSLEIKAKNEEVGERVIQKEDEWYRDEDTPVKVFFRKFKELKQVKAELAIREREGGVSSGNSSSPVS